LGLSLFKFRRSVPVMEAVPTLEPNLVH
jgi:hypothetical protein